MIEFAGDKYLEPLYVPSVNVERCLEGDNCSRMSDSIDIDCEGFSHFLNINNYNDNQINAFKP